MRVIEELGNCEIIRNIEKACSDIRGHGGDEGTRGGLGQPEAVQ
jgi:hypothetical protein